MSIVAFLIMLAALLVVVALIGVVNAQLEFHFGFRIEDASDNGVNGLYVCASDSRCSRIEPIFSGSQLKYELSSTSVLVNGHVQKRWFISTISANGSTANVYGAIELQSLPQFKLKEWKHLGEQSAFEPNMKTAPINIPLQLEGPVSLQDTVGIRNALEGTRILLALKNGLHFDATSMRGRYVTQSLRAHHNALLLALYGDIALSASVSASSHLDRREDTPEGELLVRVHLCDTSAALGAFTEAGACYQATTALLTQHTRRTYDATSGEGEASGLALGRHQFSSLHCGNSGTDTSAGELPEGHTSRYWHCQLRALQLRHVRMLLLYSLDPLGALSVLDSLSAGGVTSTQAEIWRLLAQSMLGEPVSSTGRKVPVTSVAEECDAILAELAQSSDYSLVHALFAQICARLQHSSVRLADAVDQARPMVASLLSVGAVIPAAGNVQQVVRAALGMPRLPLDAAYTEKLLPTLLSDPAVQSLLQTRCRRGYSSSSSSSLTNGTDATLVATLAGSDNLRAALILYQLLRDIRGDIEVWRIFLQDGDLMSLLLGALLQVTAPVTLNLSPHEEVTAGYENGAFCTSPPPCFMEALLLRRIAVDVLHGLVSACNGAESGCMLSDPVSNVGARGLFLLAYQGLGLLPPPSPPSAVEICAEASSILRDDASGGTCEDHTSAMVRWEALQELLRDSTVPSLYEQLLKLTQEHSRVSSHGIPRPSSQDNVGLHGSSEASPAPALAKVRVGFLSFFFRKHPVGRLLSPIIVGLDRSQFDVYIIAKSETLHPGATVGGGSDVITHYLRTHVPDEKWVLIDHNTVSAAERVQALELDIVVYGDVFMDSYVANLAVQRLAPVQVAFWGHPYTTGYPSVDYFITSDLFEAPNAQFRHAHFSEQLVRFDSLSFQLLEEDDADTSSTRSISSSSSSSSSGADAAAPHSVSPARRPLPLFVPRTVRSIWDDCALTAGNTTKQSPASTEHGQRRSAVEWITAVGYTVYDTPVVAAEVLQAVAVASVEADGTRPMYLSSAELCDTALAVRLYGALQSLFKLHPLFDRAAAQILIADPKALIILSRTGKQRVWEERFRNRLIRSVTYHWEVSCHGKATVGRCQTVDALLKRILFVNQMKHEHYNALLCTMDVTLDTFPFGGGVTLSDALHGCSPAVPFVTQGALQSVHRIGEGITTKLSAAESSARPSHAQQQQKQQQLRCDGRASTIASDGAVDLQHLVDGYVTEAVATAARSALQRGEGSGAGGGAAHSSRDQIRQALFRSSESVQEWAMFLQSAHVALRLG